MEMNLSALLAKSLNMVYPSMIVFQLIDSEVKMYVGGRGLE